VPEQESEKDHDRYENVAFPGHEGEKAALAFHRKNARKISVCQAAKSEVMDHQGAGKSWNHEEEVVGWGFPPQPRTGETIQQDAHAEPHSSRRQQKNAFGDCEFAVFQTKSL